MDKELTAILLNILAINFALLIAAVIHYMPMIPN